MTKVLPYCYHIGTALWPLCDRFYNVLWPKCDQSVTTLEPFCDHFGTPIWTLNPSSKPRFQAILQLFPFHSGAYNILTTEITHFLPLAPADCRWPLSSLLRLIQLVLGFLIDSGRRKRLFSWIYFNDYTVILNKINTAGQVHSCLTMASSHTMVTSHTYNGRKEKTKHPPCRDIHIEGPGRGRWWRGGGDGIVAGAGDRGGGVDAGCSITWSLNLCMDTRDESVKLFGICS